MTATPARTRPFPGFSPVPGVALPRGRVIADAPAAAPAGAPLAAPADAPAAPVEEPEPRDPCTGYPFSMLMPAQYDFQSYASAAPAAE